MELCRVGEGLNGLDMIPYPKRLRHGDIMAKKYLLYTICLAPDHAPRGQYWSEPVFDEKKYSFKPAKPPEKPPVPSKPAEPNYNCWECGAFSFVEIEFCDICLQAAELSHYCRECGAFSFVEIDYCDSCRKPRKREASIKKPSRESWKLNPRRKKRLKRLKSENWET